jgi:TrmH family RNA methyltransferase
MSKLSKAQLKFLNSLQIKKYRQIHQAFLVEGEKICFESITAQWEILHFYCTETFAQKHEAALESLLTSPILVEDTELGKAGSLSTNTQCLAVLKMPEMHAPKPVQHYAIALDRIQDPGNLGTILRIADWYGIEQVICSQDTVDAYHPKTIAASMGSFLRVSSVYVELEAYLQTQGLPKYGATLQGQDLHKFEFLPKGILLMGNESQGLSLEIEKLCDAQIQIPRFGEAESLNVAVATAIICDNLRRQLPDFR